MKKRAFALVLLALTLCLSFAAADEQNTVYPVDADRILYELPTGMAAKSIEKTDGLISVVIDAQNTDWEKVLLYGYEASTGLITNRLGYKAPEGAFSCLSTGMSYNPEFDSEAWVLEILNELTVYDTPHEADHTYNGAEIARYLPQTELLQPKDVRDHAIVTSWFKEDGTLLRHEMLRLEITYTDTGSLYQSLAKMPASRVLETGFIFREDPVWDYEHIADGEALTSVVTEGAVRYQVLQLSGIYNSEALHTLITAPEGADNSYTVCVGSSGSDLWDRHVYQAGEVVAGISLTRPAFLIGLHHGRSEGVSETTQIVEWRNGSGEIVEVYQLDLQTVVGDPLPTPYYTNWDPVPADRLIFMDTDLGSLQLGAQPGKSVNGVEFSLPMDGWMHLGVDENNLPTGQQLIQADFTPRLIPPQGATHYKHNNSGGNNIFGAEFAPEFVEVQEEITGNRMDAEPIPEDGVVYLMDLNPVMRYESNGLTVFLPIGLAGEYAGGIQTIFWYDSADPNAEPIKREYFVNTQSADRFARVEETAALESAPQQHIELPVIVVSGALAGRELTLVIEIYPQSSDTAIYYELYLIDAQKERVSLGGETCQLYLPYPDGMDQFSEDVEFVIYHYTDYTNNPAELSVSQTFSEADGSVERTESGLLITVHSLSPFILSWGDGAMEPGEGGCGHGSHDLFYEDHGGVLEERCQHCDHLSVLILGMPDLFPEGEEVFVDLIVAEMEWLGENQDFVLPEPRFMDETGSELDALPTQPGFYTVFVEQGGVRTFREFMIEGEGMGGGEEGCEQGHQMVFEDHGNLLEGHCDRCGIFGALTIVMQDSYIEGEAITASLSLLDGVWIGENGDGAYPELRYYTADMKPLTNVPGAPGSYMAAIEAGGVRTMHPFTILAANVTLPPTGDNSLPLALLALAAAASLGVLLMLLRRRK